MPYISTASNLSVKTEYRCQYLSGPRTEELATGVFCDRCAAEFQDLLGTGGHDIRQSVAGVTGVS